MNDWERLAAWRATVGDELSQPPKNDYERDRQEMLRRTRALAAPLIKELQSVGLPATSVGDLGNVRVKYPEAVPILLNHLWKDYPENIVGAIIQALVIDYGGPVVFQNLHRFLSERWERLSRDHLFTLGNALGESGTTAEARQLLSIIRDSKYGVARYKPALKVARMRDPRVREGLLDYFDSGEKAIAAMKALRIAKIGERAEAVRERYLTSKNLEQRAEAKKYLKRFAPDML